jgi:hypothetical protein
LAGKSCRHALREIEAKGKREGAKEERQDCSNIFKALIPESGFFVLQKNNIFAAAL